MHINPDAFPEQCILEGIGSNSDPFMEFAEEASRNLKGNVNQVLEIIDFVEPLLTRALLD